MYVTIKEVKKHLQIDYSFTDDDQYLESLIKVSEDSVANHLDVALEDIA